jgi:Zn-dependent protease with chaperone function
MKQKKLYPLTKAKIYNFLENVIGEYNFTVQFGNGKDCEGSAACVLGDNIIIVNKHLFHQYTQIEQKAILLHEAGHVIIGDLRSSTATEYQAHLWALAEAKKQGWKSVYKELESTIISWINYEWNEDKGIWRPYIRAGRKYLRRKRERQNIKKIIKI